MRVDMKNGPEIMKRWRIKLDKNIRKNLVSSVFLKKEPLLAVRDIYLTDIALAVHFIVNLNTGERLDNIQDDVKQAIGQILLILSGYAEQQGIVVPVMGIVSPAGNLLNKELETAVSEWAADQDWHRGDFSLLFARGEEAGDVICSILSGASVIWTEREKIKPLDSQVYLALLKNEYRARETTGEHRELVEKIIRAWEDDKPIGNAVLEWVAEYLSEIDEITGQR